MLTCEDIVSGLQSLGLRHGDGVIVHSSLSSLGEVEGGADTVVEALLRVVGSEGTVMVPTFGCVPPFDRRRSATTLGAIPEALWRRDGAVRSLHPTHSVAAIGRSAADLLADHERAPSACGPGTPYFRLAMGGGKALLIGVDQDSNTTLHTAEFLAGVPYLTDVAACYVTDEGRTVVLPVSGVANSHRDFTALESALREGGAMRVGRIGSAACRLLDGRKMLEIATDALRRDPNLALCSNPNCSECATNRGRVKAARMGEESFVLGAVAGEISPDTDTLLNCARREGVSALEVTAREYRQLATVLQESHIRVIGIRGRMDDHESVDLAGFLNIPLIAPVSTLDELERARDIGVEVLAENCRAQAQVFARAYSVSPDLPRMALNPGEFATVGDRPLHDVLFVGPLRRMVGRVYVADATFDGKRTLPGEGNGQVKEVLSLLRCRGFDGAVVLRSGLHNSRAFPRVAESFWRMFDAM